MVTAWDCRSINEDVCAGSIPGMGNFFFNDGGASRKARALKRVQSTKPEGGKRPRM